MDFVFMDAAREYNNHPPQKLLMATIAIAVSLLGLFIFQSPQVLVRYYSDDAFYYFQVARHLSLGDGPTFDGVTWTTGFHPLYAWLLAAGQRALPIGEDGIPALANAINAAAFFLTAWFLYLTASRLWNSTAGLWAAMLWLCNPHAILLAGTGMEGLVYAACLALFAFRFLISFHSLHKDSERWLFHSVGLGLAGSLCVLARTDSLLLIAMSGLLLLGWPTSQWRKRFLPVCVFAAAALLPYLGWLLYCHAFTGQWLQGSAQMKRLLREMSDKNIGVWSQIASTISLFAYWILKNIIKVPLLKFVLPFYALLPVSKTKNEPPNILSGLPLILWLFPLLLGLAYSCYLPRFGTWYYAPGIVYLTLLAAGMLTLLLCCNADALWIDRFRRWRWAILIIILLESYGYLALKGIHGRNAYQRAALETAYWIDKNIPQDARLGSWNAGIYSWYSRRTVINLDGLINNEIPVLYAKNGSICQYILDRGIEYIVDGSTYMKDFCPHWGDGDYRIIHTYSGNGKELAIWKMTASSNKDSSYTKSY